MRALVVAAWATGCSRTAPSFQRDVLPVMAKQCASADGCHGEKPTDSVKLDLRPDAAYAELVNAKAEAREGWVRVAPGQPDASFLLEKLRGRLGASEGKAMPIDTETGAPVEPSPLPPDYIEKVLVPWIASGAKDDATPRATPPRP
jgi:hypothetical protein